MLERMSKVEETLTKLVIMEENSMATIRNIEIQTNPKEHCNKVITEKEEETENLEREMKRSEEEKLKIRREVFLKKIYHILILLQKQRMTKNSLTNCSLGIILLEI